MAINMYHNLSKFEELGIRKQEQAYKKTFAKKAFEYSCKLCCEQNKRPCGTCNNCPIKEAHIKALAEIESGKRFCEPRKNPGYSTYKSKVHGEIKVTMVMHF